MPDDYFSMWLIEDQHELIYGGYNLLSVFVNENWFKDVNVVGIGCEVLRNGDQREIIPENSDSCTIVVTAWHEGEKVQLANKVYNVL